MIKEQDKNMAQWVMDYALKQGCDAARISFITGENNSFEYRNIQLDKLQQSSENKLYIELFIGNKYGSFSTNRIEKEELEIFIKESVLSVKYLEADVCRQLPDKGRYFQGGNEDSLDQCDPSFHLYGTEEKLDLLKKNIEEIYGTDKHIISITASLNDGIGAEYMITSNGFEGLNQDTAFSLSVEVALKAETDARPESYWYDSTVYWSDLQKKGVASRALERALWKIGQKKIKSGRYQMLVDNTVSARLLAPLISAMYGTALQQKNSFLLDLLGKNIISDKITVYDRPHIKRAFGARMFDGEGVATNDRKIIDSGVLNTYFIDTYNSLKMNMEPTISSPSILTIDNGKMDFDGIMKTVNMGIWVTGFNGGNTNPTTGDFSFGVEGFFIENGIPTQPVSEMNITGNILTLWNNVIEWGNDPRNNTSWRIPSILFSDVNFSGL